MLNHRFTLQGAAGADIVMLDNYKPADLIEDGKRLKAAYPSILVEASGVRKGTEVVYQYTQAVIAIRLLVS